MLADDAEGGPGSRFHEPIRLVGGVNFSTWPDLKWSRGNSHVGSLQSSLGEWHASAPVSVDPVLRYDRLGIDLIARVPRGIPKHEWSLDLGDALHNFRSAFDAVAWGMAHFNEATPTRPKSVQFPICTEKTQWEKALKAWVGELHPEFQERLRIMQPFTYAPDGSKTVLSMLHDLDIQDKHRDILTVTADLHQLNLGGSFEYLDEGVEVPPSVDMRTDVKFGDGVRLGTIHTGAPIQMVGQMILRPGMKVELTYGDTKHDVLTVLHQFAAETRRYLDILMNGLAAPGENDETEWLPMNVGAPASGPGVE